MSSWNGVGRPADIGPSHVLHLLLSAARLHVAARHASRQLGPSAQHKAPPSLSGPKGGPNLAAQSTADIWTKLLDNPAVKNPNQALSQLQWIFDQGLLDSILPYIVSSLDLQSSPPDSPRRNTLVPSPSTSSSSTLNPSSASALNPSSASTLNPSSASMLNPDGQNPNPSVSSINPSVRLPTIGSALKDSTQEESEAKVPTDKVASPQSDIQKILQSAIRSNPGTPKKNRKVFSDIADLRSPANQSENDSASAAATPRINADTATAASVVRETNAGGTNTSDNATNEDQRCYVFILTILRLR
ncbi:putative protein TPRXL [Hyalella azteca]|uniref:Uncharacterized protein n=1 Tax=Hyalella azteca TaxID=294128 RepID=A0A979FWV1_HYAAZ|nr:putative protein TPRXL [Hyalella azteca]